jgi:vanillate/3-O-methylgallate O-demethylase
MPAPSLQDGIEQAGSPVRLLWKPNAAPWLPEVVEPEYAGWRQEQDAWHTGVSISDVSHQWPVSVRPRRLALVERA